jgi:hemerythrin
LKKEVEKLKRENEEHIRKIEHQNKTMFELINKMFVSVVIIKQGGEIEFANTAVEQFLGYSEIEVAGINIERIIEKPPTAGNQPLCEYLFENMDFINKEGGKEFYVKDKQGDLKKVRLEISIIGEGDERRLVIFFKDLQFLEAKEKETDRFVDEMFELEFENILKLEFYEDFLKKQGLEIPAFVLDEEEIIKWGPKFQLGVKMIDNQHKKWIEFINKFYSALIKKKDIKELNETLRKLSNYTEYHFSFEEKYMKEFNYENFDEHHKEHDLFVKQLNQFFNDYVEGKIGTIHRIILYLKKWVVQHVLVTDKKYVDLFKKHGLR